jgi:hypothetical protein
LDDESLDVAVEDGTIIVLLSAKSQEVLGSFGAQLAIELDFDIAMGCVKGDRHSINSRLFKLK